MFPHATTAMVTTLHCLASNSTRSSSCMMRFTSAPLRRDGGRSRFCEHSASSAQGRRSCFTKRRFSHTSKPARQALHTRPPPHWNPLTEFSGSFETTGLDGERGRNRIPITASEREAQYRDVRGGAPMCIGTGPFIYCSVFPARIAPGAFNTGYKEPFKTSRGSHWSAATRLHI